MIRKFEELSDIAVLILLRTVQVLAMLFCAVFFFYMIQG